MHTVGQVMSDPIPSSAGEYFGPSAQTLPFHAQGAIALGYCSHGQIERVAKGRQRPSLYSSPVAPLDGVSERTGRVLSPPSPRLGAE